MNIAYGPQEPGGAAIPNRKWIAPEQRVAIDLDAHSTYPLDPAVLDAMLPFLRERYGNTESAHARGRAADVVLEQARADLAGLLGVPPGEVVFTSGATESNNAAIVGAYLAWRATHPGETGHVVSQPTEHSCVLRSLDVLAAMGCEVTMVPVDQDGRVSPEAVAAAARPDTVLVSIMHANNEVGTVQPIADIVRLVRAANPETLTHSDMAQSFGRVRVAPEDLPDLAVCCAHKLGGPQGIGALRIRTGVPVQPIIVGGSQEEGRRAGTVNLAGAVGFGWACYLLATDPTLVQHETAMRDRLLAALAAGLPEGVLWINGPLDPTGHAPELRLPHNLHVTLLGVCPMSLKAALDGRVNVSSASACKKGNATSHVLAAMGAPDDGQGAPVRFGVSRFTTEAEVDEAARIVCDAARVLAGKGCAVPGRKGK